MPALPGMTAYREYNGHLLRNLDVFRPGELCMVRKGAYRVCICITEGEVVEVYGRQVAIGRNGLPSDVSILRYLVVQGVISGHSLRSTQPSCWCAESFSWHVLRYQACGSALTSTMQLTRGYIVSIILSISIRQPNVPVSSKWDSTAQLDNRHSFRKHHSELGPRRLGPLRYGT